MGERAGERGSPNGNFLQGSDTLYAGLNNDALYGGDDRLNYDADDLRIRGDAGEDTLIIAGSGVTLDLRNLDGLDLRGIDVVDLNGSGANTLMLNARDVLHISDHGVLRVMGGVMTSLIHRRTCEPVTTLARSISTGSITIAGILVMRVCSSTRTLV